MVLCVLSVTLLDWFAFIKEIYFWGRVGDSCVLFYLHYVFVSLGRASFVGKVIFKFVISHRDQQRLHFSVYDHSFIK